MTEASIAYRWTRSEFLRAWEAEAFDHRVELIEGEVWPVVIGDWHGFTVGRIIARLPRVDVEVTTAALPTGDSLPAPDCWALRSGAEPVDTVGTELSAWTASDVLLVVEVSDEAMAQDLGRKAVLYGRAGYPVYWVVTTDAIHEYTEPTSQGYRTRTSYWPGDRIPVHYAGTELAVEELLSSR
ncbi:Uma2 family endonuclease [Nocardia amamiensis]|uniref:Uma2 family endonuclease n=1 Tax=Nocardia amamiensis TaxID=404578 RepID=UPI0008376AE2|nr:Uma2 family endonuclease [Nocardia amamiensis]